MVTATTKHGVTLNTKIIDSSNTEIAIAKPTVQNLSHEAEVSYTQTGRGAKVRVNANVIQNVTVGSHASGSPFPFLFLSVWKGTPRTLAEPFTLHGTTGQVVIDCGSIDVEDIWTGLWNNDVQPAQVVLDVRN